jgi:molybdenum cofactor synthesis domain-containing protein
MNPTLEIFSQGEEIVTGQTVDTNAAWLAQQGVICGFTVTRHTAVGDKINDLVELLQNISQRADCCICTGGLGPTSDDLTAEAVAIAFNLLLE